MRTVTVCLALLGLAVAFPAHAQWVPPAAPANNHPNTQFGTLAAGDGQGGIVVAWHADYSGGNFHVYAQRFDRFGVKQWGSEGVIVCDASSSILRDIISDSSGNTYYTWYDQRNGNWDVWVQKLDISGNRQWAVNGVAVVTEASTQVDGKLALDGSGGVICAWEDLRSGSNDVLAMRVTNAGATAWLLDGVGVSTAANDQDTIEIISDGAGGVIVVWEDIRSGLSDDIYAQRINNLGISQWTFNGLLIDGDVVTEQDPVLVSDGAGGAIIAWEDGNVGNADITATRLDGAGATLWGPTPVCNQNSQTDPVIASDGFGGAIIAWEDFRDANHDVYVQRMLSTGLAVWTNDGLPLVVEPGEQLSPKVSGDGDGGAIVLWFDGRTSPGQVYAEHVSAAGATVWSTNALGVAITQAPEIQQPVEVVPDGSGSVLFSVKNSVGPIDRASAQRIDGRHGYWGHPEPMIASASDTPADQGGFVTLEWDASGRDLLYEQLITHYSVWRATSAISASSGVAPERLVQASEIGEDFDGVAFRYEASAAGEFYWEWVANQDAAYANGYIYNVTTKLDSVGGEPALHYFQVIAHTADQFVFWPSPPDSGYSVDNLAPSVPQGFAVAYNAGSNLLSWDPSNDVDFQFFRIYRSTDPNFTPAPGNLVHATTDTLWHDTAPDASWLYNYKLTAVDFSGNESDPTGPLTVTAITDPAGSTTYTLYQNVPNPFNPTTVIRYDVPTGGGVVTLRVYDVTGRLVRTLVDGVQTPGQKAVTWRGRNNVGQPVTSGVYFYRLMAPRFVQTHKMALLK